MVYTLGTNKYAYVIIFEIIDEINKKLTLKKNDY